VLYGVSVYVLLPLSLLKENIQMLLIIFFGLLLGMLFGLILIAFNFQKGIELLVTYLLFFWERKSMRKLIIKNLAAHRLKNQLTAIIYSLTLGTLICIIVVANVQIQLINSSGTYKDTDIRIFDRKGFLASQIDPVLQQYAYDIKDFGSVTLEYTG